MSTYWRLDGSALIRMAVPLANWFLVAFLGFVTLVLLHVECQNTSTDPSTGRKGLPCGREKQRLTPCRDRERGKRGSNIELGINPRWQKCASLAAWDSVSLDSALRKWVMRQTRSQFDGVVPPLCICPCRWKRRNEVALFLHLIQKIDP